MRTEVGLSKWGRELLAALKYDTGRVTAEDVNRWAHSGDYGDHVWCELRRLESMGLVQLKINTLGRGEWVAADKAASGSFARRMYE